MAASEKFKIENALRNQEISHKRGMNVLYNRKPEPLPGFRFKVYINHIPMGFTKITNLEETSDITTLQEGGYNNQVHILEQPVSTEHTLIMERGVVLLTLTRMIFNRQLDIGQRIFGDVMITLHDRNGWVGRCFWVNNAYVKKISYDGFDSMNGNPVIQRFELAYERMESKGLPGIPDVFY
ncbi:MAG: phage tail protein [Oscillospiraceae bacterium]